jgi:hypothetical protein
MFAREDLAKRQALALAVLPLLILLAALWAAAPARAEFGIASLSSDALTKTGEVDTRAGGHPYELSTKLEFTRSTQENGNGEQIMVPTENLRSLRVDLPVGVIGNPRAMQQCPEALFDLGECPNASQVGLVSVEQAIGISVPIASTFPLYDVVPPLGVPAVFGFAPGLFPVHSTVLVRSESDFGLSYELHNIPQPTAVVGTTVILWGVPGDEGHDPERGQFCTVFGPFKNCVSLTGRGPGPIPGPHKAFLTNPTDCGGQPLVATAVADTWQHPDAQARATTESAATTECDKVEFDPSLKARPTTNVTDSPSGLDVNLKLRQNEEEGNELATSQLRDAVVNLPPGLVLNPASANGLEACSPAQIGLSTPVGDAKPKFNTAKPSCPDGAQIGSVEIDTPAFADPLKGQVLLAAQHDNPFGSLLALYVFAEGHGVVIKLAGEASPDPKTGQLKTTFLENPRQPVEELRLKLFSGAVAPLRTPASCGTYATTAVLTPWSAPQSGPPATLKDEYAINRTPGGAACASSEAGLPSTTSFEAGTASAIAGSYTPFVLKLSRNDGTQQLTGIDASLPAGLLAKLAGVPYCPDASLATASGKSGKDEQSSASCPAASQVGTVTVGAGAGPKPFFAPGKAYLAGPYKGAPLSLAVVVPAVAGPFDLGTVVVRNALHIDPTTTQVHAVSDPFPTILQGIPLDIRSIDLELSKPEFTRNPTSCDPSAVTGSASLLTGQSSPLSSRFQVAECGRLAFKPKLALKLKGETKRTGNPAVRALLTQPVGGANIASTTVMLPKGEFIDNRHISSPCTRVQFNANACPKKSILGSARAYSPLLDKPLEGPVYFRSNGGERELPDMVADLGGQIHVTLVGFIDSVKVKGTEQSRVRTRFLSVPDAPVSRFELSLYGGKRGLLQNSVDLCRVGLAKASLSLTAHNGVARNYGQKVATSCHGKKKGKKKHHGGGKGPKR